MKEGFKSVKEILLEVAEDEGMTWTEIEDVWLHQKKFIKDKMEEEEVYSIFIPFIGTMSLNVKQYIKEIKYRNKDFYSKFISKVEKLKNHKNYTKYGNSHKKTTAFHRLVSYIIDKFEVEENKKYTLLAHKKCWELISKYSNGVLKKKENGF